MVRKLRYIWGLAVSALALPFVLFYGVLIIVQMLLLATFLAFAIWGSVLKKSIVVMHETIGPTANDNEDLSSPLTKFNKFIMSKEIIL